MPSVPATTLDPGLNVAPEQVRHVHLMGICGTGMGALAGMLKSAGLQVTGSDANVYPPMSTFLAGMGIVVANGYGPENLVPRPDLVVVGNVIRRHNPEAVALAAAGIPYLSFPQALAHYFIGDRTSLVVCGTHGKTTTASLLATMLQALGQPPSFMIGGLVAAFNRNYNVAANSPWFVAEGDEYDTAFFDKGPKFLHYRPRVAVLTSVEFDHADIFADFAAVQAVFRRLVDALPADGLLVACWDDPEVRRLAGLARCAVASYGESAAATWQLREFQGVAGGAAFAVHRNGRFFGRFSSPMLGRHNALNALAVLIVLSHLGFDARRMAPALTVFTGVKRRQEVRGEVNGITVIDDFAHHPTAVRETLAALRSGYGARRLVVVFEARTNSSRRKIFQQRYAEVFDDADLVVVREPEPLANVAPEDRFSAHRLVEDLCSRGRNARYFDSPESILQWLPAHLVPGDVVAILSNGGFADIHARLLALLEGNDDGNEKAGPESAS